MLINYAVPVPRICANRFGAEVRQKWENVLKCIKKKLWLAASMLEAEIVAVILRSQVVILHKVSVFGKSLWLLTPLRLQVLYHPSKEHATYFLNSSLIHWPIQIVFGMQHCGET